MGEGAEATAEGGPIGGGERGGTSNPMGSTSAL
jgi:hypothetical protein